VKRSSRLDFGLVMVLVVIAVVVIACGMVFGW
jgi:hypothetical protein